MNAVAKLLLCDENDRYLLLTRSNHPLFFDDPDLPGGTIEDDETAEEAVIREVDEETGITIKASQVALVYVGSEFSQHNTDYYLYTAKVGFKPDVSISWEHASYEWVSKDDLLKQAKGANDTYMHMVHHVLTTDNTPQDLSEA